MPVELMLFQLEKIVTPAHNSFFDALENNNYWHIIL